MQNKDDFMSNSEDFFSDTKTPYIISRLTTPSNHRELTHEIGNLESGYKSFTFRLSTHP
jgi:hypothetical protein